MTALNLSTRANLSSFTDADISSLDIDISDEELTDSLLGNMHKLFFVQFCRPYHAPYYVQEVFVNVMQEFVLVNFANRMVFANCFHDDKVWELFAEVMLRRSGFPLFYHIHNVSIH